MVAAGESSGSTPRQNHLLAALPAIELERLSSHLELVPMLLGEVLHESGSHVQHVYFPTSSILSLHYVMENGASAEVAGVGNEGLLGVSVFMGGDSTPNRALVQTAGHGYRLKSKLLLEEFNRGGPMLRLLLRYSQAFITQIAQTGACNRHAWANRRHLRAAHELHEQPRPSAAPQPDTQRINLIAELMAGAHLTGDQRQAVELRLAGYPRDVAAAEMARTRDEVRCLERRAVRYLRTIAGGAL